MSFIVIKSIAALLIFSVSLLAGLRPLRSAHVQPEHRLFVLGDALGGGVFLGIGLFHMLPDAQSSFLAAYGPLNYPFANLFCALGFVTLLFLEKVILRVVQQHRVNQVSLVPYVLPIVLSVHALTEGTALGINTTLVNILVIFIAIIVHKGSESFALATNLGRSQIGLSHAMPIFLLWAIMSPLGVLLGSVLANNLQSHNGMVMSGIFNAFAAGTFLYIATLHKVSHICAEERNDHFYEFLLLILGLGLMAVVEVWL